MILEDIVVDASRSFPDDRILVPADAIPTLAFSSIEGAVGVCNQLSARHLSRWHHGSDANADGQLLVEGRDFVDDAELGNGTLKSGGDRSGTLQIRVR